MAKGVKELIKSISDEDEDTSSIIDTGKITMHREKALMQALLEWQPSNPTDNVARKSAQDTSPLPHSATRTCNFNATGITDAELSEATPIPSDKMINVCVMYETEAQAMTAAMTDAMAQQSVQGVPKLPSYAADVTS